jgi:hypothetical protein
MIAAEYTHELGRTELQAGSLDGPHTCSAEWKAAAVTAPQQPWRNTARARGGPSPSAVLRRGKDSRARSLYDTFAVPVRAAFSPGAGRKQRGCKHVLIDPTCTCQSQNCRRCRLRAARPTANCSVTQLAAHPHRPPTRHRQAHARRRGERLCLGLSAAAARGG